MTKYSLASARLFAIKYAKVHAPRKERLRKETFILILEIVRAFFPEPAAARVSCYGHLGMGLVIAEAPNGLLLGERHIEGPCNQVIYNGETVVVFSKGRILPESGMLELPQAEAFALMLQQSGLLKILDELRNFRGKEAAQKLADKLGMKLKER